MIIDPVYPTLVGRRCAGKEVFSKYAWDKYGILPITFGVEIGRMGVEKGIIEDWETKLRARLQYAGEKIREEWGIESYVKRAIEGISGEPHVLDGIRFQAELDCLRKELGEGVTLIGIESDYANRLARALEIRRAESVHDFEQQEAHPSESEIDALVAASEHRIPNNGSIEEFYEKIDDLFIVLEIERTKIS